MNKPCIVRAVNDLLLAEDGRQYIDLFTAHGTAWLGHANPAIAADIAAQLDRVWLTGGLETPASRAAAGAIEAWFPASHGLAALYSTGMEAAEFAIRVARIATGRTGMLGFERSMHGKSLATAYLGWDNRDGVQLPGFRRLPFPGRASEADVLAQLAATLAGARVGGVFVEPLQGSGGGHLASPGFYREVARLAREHGALLVFDELLTGFHRTGPAFLFEEFGLAPDVVLIGKALGNGFPVSAVIVDRSVALRREMLPGSTFSGNALACAAIKCDAAADARAGSAREGGRHRGDRPAPPRTAARSWNSAARQGCAVGAGAARRRHDRARRGRHLFRWRVHRLRRAAAAGVAGGDDRSGQSGARKRRGCAGGRQGP
jgi:acetylornithine/succinyldiaminopimelate/putrescine aminotransferase